MYKEKRNILLTALLFLQIGLVKLSSYYPAFIEAYYSRGIYPKLSLGLRKIFGWLEVSVGDMLYALLIFLLLRILYRFVRKGKKPRRAILFELGAAVSIFYFAFYLLWGLNYSRNSLAENLGLSSEKYDIAKVEAITTRLINKTRELHQNLALHDTLPVVIPYSKTEIIRMTSIGYEELSKELPEFSYRNESIKKSLFSLPLTYMGFAGYLNPLTGEAQVDKLIPAISFPLTCSHEVSHQLGIAYENEANFVGFLAAAAHKDPYFNYSSMVFALRYALSDLYRYDKEIFQKYMDQVPPGVIKNWKESDLFWQSYENPFEPFFKLFYDGYLKYNQQEHGLETYNQIMGLLISFEQAYPYDYY